MSPPPPAQSLALDSIDSAVVSIPQRTGPQRTRPQRAQFWTKLAAAAGPGYLVAVGYMDPGNWATDIAGGSQFGYALLPVIVISSLAAMFLQWLALRLGIATGRDLAQHSREQYSRTVAFALWATCEIAIVACDVAEVIGTAIALKLLFHLPLLIGVSITAFDTLIILGLQRYGFRHIEAFVIALISIVGACFAYELFVSHPAAHDILAAFTPGRIPFKTAALYLSLAIFGATVMPHNLYLHSAISQSRRIAPTIPAKRDAIRFSTIDCLTALTLALLINVAILITAAAAFHWSGHAGVQTIEDAYKLLSPSLGAGAASVVFAIALLAAGQNSTLTGTMAGQIVMEGFLGLKTSSWVQRLLTRSLAILPVLAVTMLAGESATAQLLILSQVVLSLQLGFAVVPLVRFTSDTKIMGPFANGGWVKASGYCLAALIVVVNAWLVLQSL
jgi:manganese transport protein